MIRNPWWDDMVTRHPYWSGVALTAAGSVAVVGALEAAGAFAAAGAVTGTGDVAAAAAGAAAEAAEGVALTSAEAGELIGWGTGQSAEAVAQTRAVTENLTEAIVKDLATKGLTRDWVTGQLTQYQSAIAKAGVKLVNQQLLPRAELMAKILALWPK
jgi:hypothetical protein